MLIKEITVAVVCAAFFGCTTSRPYSLSGGISSQDLLKYQGRAIDLVTSGQVRTMPLPIAPSVASIDASRPVLFWTEAGKPPVLRVTVPVQGSGFAFVAFRFNLETGSLMGSVSYTIRPGLQAR